MYHKGDVKLVEPQHWITDAKDNNYSRIMAPCAYLEHSCDEWAIGGIENIKQMITDLQDVLKEMGEEI